MPTLAQRVLPFDCSLCGVAVNTTEPVKGSKPNLRRQLCGPCKCRDNYARRTGRSVADLRTKRPNGDPGVNRKRQIAAALGSVIRCPTCAASFCKESPNQKFCSVDCYNAAENEKERARRGGRKRLAECSWCGSRVLREKPSESGRYFCSSLCQWGYKRCVVDGVVSVSWPKSQPCIECGEQYQTKSKTAKSRCPRCYAAHVESLKVDQACQDCGEIVRAQPGLKRCRDCRKRHNGRKTSRRNNNRHLRRRTYIVERDGGRCQVCRCQVVWGNPLHPRAGEIDHIIPRSLWPVGEPGKNDPSNLRLLCRTCNAQKSNGTAPGGDQLLLVG